MNDSLWLGPLLAGASAFLGVLCARSIEIWKQRRVRTPDMVGRLPDDRRRLYAEFLSCISRITHQVDCAVARADPRLLPDPQAEEREAGRLGNEIALVGTEETVKAMVDLESSCMGYLISVGQRTESSSLTMDASERDEWKEWIRNDMRAFTAAARKELLVDLAAVCAVPKAVSGAAHRDAAGN